MGRFQPKYQPELAQAVGEAVANGAKAPHVAAQLEAGTFPGWDEPVQMPLATIRYYGKRERNHRAAKAVRPEAKEAPKKAVDDLARLLLSAAMEGLEKARPQIDSDPKALKDWADALKQINSLVSDTATGDTDKRGKPKRQPVPTDPLSARLLTTQEKTTDNSGEAAHDTAINDKPATHQNTDSGGVAAQVPNPDHGPHLNGGGPAGPPGAPYPAPVAPIPGT